jgi:hypothetical protein
MQRPRRSRLAPSACLIIRLIIQTIRRDRSGSVQTDKALNVSRPDPSGPDQIDAEHQATDLAVGFESQSGLTPASTRWVNNGCDYEPGNVHWATCAEQH